MSAVLVTGSAGRVGRALVSRLRAANRMVRSFDLASGDDLRDESAVFEAIEGCDAVVHAGAIAHDNNGTPSEILATNVLGTWHVLLAAERHAVSRVVYFSSAQVLASLKARACRSTAPSTIPHIIQSIDSSPPT